MPGTMRLLFDPDVRIQGMIGENNVSDFLVALKAISAYSRAGARMIGADRWPLSHWSDIEAELVGLRRHWRQHRHLSIQTRDLAILQRLRLHGRVKDGRWGGVSGEAPGWHSDLPPRHAHLVPQVQEQPIEAQQVQTLGSGFSVCPSTAMI